MKDCINSPATFPGTFLCFFLFSLLVPNGLAAETYEECLLKKIKNAGASVTVGQLRSQCQAVIGSQPAAQSGDGESMVDRNGPAEIILKTALARKPAFFPHHRHQEKYPCGTCHHDSDYAGMMPNLEDRQEIYKCTACHNEDLPNEELNNFQDIGHALCRDCHRKNQDITSAKCTTCHRRNL